MGANVAADSKIGDRLTNESAIDLKLESESLYISTPIETSSAFWPKLGNEARRIKIEAEGDSIHNGDTISLRYDGDDLKDWDEPWKSKRKWLHVTISDTKASWYTNDSN
ncbi:MAG: hypothetical protein AAF497_05875, partial [Planctomycetota bacterium]